MKKGTAPIYELIPHTADIGIRVFGKNNEKLLKNTIYAFFDVLVGIKSINKKVEKVLKIKADNLEDLLFNLLDELLFIFSTKKMIFKESKVSFIRENQIVVKLKGQKFDPSKHKVKTDIKAVTYHDFKIKKEKNKLIAEVIFDI